MKKLYISLMAVALAATAGAQGLNKEITIEKEIVPEQRAATRLPVNHSVLAPEVKQSVPAFSSRGVNAEIAPEMYTLYPALTGDALTPSPYRGYAVLGYFPAYNLGASAGYRFIDDDLTRLGAWIQFDGFSYDRAPVSQPLDKKPKVSDNSLKAGVDFRRQLTRTGELTLNLDFGYGKNKIGNMDLFENDRTATQFHFGAGWKATAGRVDYKVSAFTGVFSNSYSDKRLEMPRQFSYGGSVGVEGFGFSLDLSAEMNNYNHQRYVNEVAEGGITMGAVRINPAYTYRTDNASLRVGVNADFSIHSGKSVVVAPDVRLDFRPDKMFGVYLAADGGVKVNSLESIYNISHFITPEYIYDNSRVPLDMRVGVVIGPFRGGSLELFGGYAKADDWLMLDHFMALAPQDVKAWHGGARLSYNWRNIIAAKASVEAAPSSEKKAYYLWRDRAKTVVNISVEAHPIKKLALEAGWELRSGRCTSQLLDVVGTQLPNPTLGNVSNLRFGVSYRITDQFTVFGRGENLLGKKWDVISMVADNGVCGLIGAGYKF